MNTMVRKIGERVKKVPWSAWILGAILILGIFFRTYEFRDWMEFNPDQARDAILVQNMMENDEWPMMGPQAGNKVFKVGPMFYYFEIISARLFGGTADKMAYADLFFSIATIILTYFFFRKFFEEKIALAVTFLLSISFFVVTYSRFAFNPNSIPFFTLLFLFSLLAILDNAPKEKLRWAVLLGIAMGVGFQLHTILYVSMPLLAVLTLGYLFVKKHFIWKSVLVALFFFTLVNAGQLTYEVENNGANIRSFFAGAKSSTESTGRNYGEDLSNDILCHIQAYTYIVSSLGSGDKCNLTNLAHRIEKKGIRFNSEKIAIAIFGTIFTLGGFILFWFYTKKEVDVRRKRALILVAVYCAIIFLILFSVSSSVSIRYFIAIEFMPFLLVGLWLHFFLDRTKRMFFSLCGGFFVMMLVVFNISTIRDAVAALENGTASTDNVAYYDEVEKISEYLLEHSNGSQTIYLAGKKSYLSRYGKPLEYFGKQQGVLVSKVYKPERITADDSFFYILKRISLEKKIPEVINGFTSEEAVVFGNVTIITLKKNP